MPKQFSISVLGEQQLARTFSRFADAVEDYRPAWPDVQTVMEHIEELQFSSQGAHGSGGWAALNPRYAAYKAARYGVKPILQRTGELKASLTENTGKSVREMRPLEFQYGTRVPYAGFHQSGTNRMPRRKLIDLTEADKRDIMRTIQRYLVSVVRRA